MRASFPRLHPHKLAQGFLTHLDVGLRQGRAQLLGADLAIVVLVQQGCDIPSGLTLFPETPGAKGHCDLSQVVGDVRAWPMDLGQLALGPFEMPPLTACNRVAVRQKAIPIPKPQISG